MGKVVYLMNVSLDGFMESVDDSTEWTTVDDELHQWFNDQTRATELMVYGRRLYETMAAYWPTAEADPAATDVMRDFARLWLATPKIVYSSTLESVDWNSRLSRGDPAAEVAQLRDEVEGEIEVAGATLAAGLVRRGIVDEYRLVVHPVVLGAGKRYFPALDEPIPLRLVDSRSFRSGALYLAYAPAR